jgi:hypothetical protein
MKKIFIILICLLFISVAVTVVTTVAGDAEKEIKRLNDVNPIKLDKIRPLIVYSFALS